MPEETRDDPLDAIFEEAAAWHARLREPGASAAERAAFARWLEGDPRRRPAYEEAIRLWAALGRPVAELVGETPAILFPGRGGEMQAPPASRRRIRRGAVAAGIAAMLAVGIWLGQGGFDDLRSDYVTAVGAQETVALADGSEVLLNTDTAIAVELDGERRVRLFRGEVFFRVAPDPPRPFVVDTADGAIRVVGTAFNVRATGEGTVVSVLHGRVEATAIQDRATLEPGQQIVLEAGGLGAATGFDATAVTAWQRGQVVFYRTPLGQVVDELNRYQHGRILVLSDRASGLKVTGVFDATRPAAVIDVIEATLGLQVTRLSDHLILLR